MSADAVSERCLRISRLRENENLEEAGQERFLLLNATISMLL
ncbi:hypothetical protein [Nostoc flagelliforme]|nr:hypothetical protein [Nostoc flagelliforme]